MNNNNNNKNKSNRKSSQKQLANNLKQQILAEIRASAGVPQQGKGRGKRNRKIKASRGLERSVPSDQLTGKGSTRNSSYGNKQSMPLGEMEYIAEVTPSAFPNFSVQSFPVNPGQSGTFPWLSRIAQNFEKYEFEYLAFVYKREVSEFATNGTTGKVIMSFDADASDPTPTNKQQMEAVLPHNDCMPCENMKLVIPPSILRKFNDAMYVRIGNQLANTDIKTYDIGNLFVACQGTAANTAIGELHVDYRLRVRIPVLSPIISTGALTGAGGSLAAATPFGAAPLSTGSYSLSGAATNVISWSGVVIGQEYSLTVGIQGTVISAFSLGTFVGCTQKSLLNSNLSGSTAAMNQATFTATATSGSLIQTVTATTVTLSLAVLSALAPSPAL